MYVLLPSFPDLELLLEADGRGESVRLELRDGNHDPFCLVWRQGAGWSQMSGRLQWHPVLGWSPEDFPGGLPEVLADRLPGWAPGWRHPFRGGLAAEILSCVPGEDVLGALLVMES